MKWRGKGPESFESLYCTPRRMKGAFSLLICPISQEDEWEARRGDGNGDGDEDWVAHYVYVKCISCHVSTPWTGGRMTQYWYRPKLKGCRFRYGNIASVQGARIEALRVGFHLGRTDFEVLCGSSLIY